MVLEADGKVYQAAEAWMKLMSIAPWYLRWVGLFGKTKPTMAMATWAYGIVAKYPNQMVRHTRLPNPHRSVAPQYLSRESAIATNHPIPQFPRTPNASEASGL